MESRGGGEAQGVADQKTLLGCIGIILAMPSDHQFEKLVEIARNKS
jgi:hypothetical protein